MENNDLDILEFASFCLKKCLVIILTTIIGLSSFWFITKNYITPKYSSESQIYIRSSSLTSSLSVSDLQVSNYLSSDYEVIFQSRPVLEKTIKKLDVDLTTGQLKKMIEITNEPETRILTVKATSDDPAFSRDIVNTIVEFGISTVNEIDSKEPYVISKAIVNSNPVSPILTKNMVIGGLVGMLTGLICLFITFYISLQETTEELIESKFKIPVIGRLPEDKNISYIKGGVKNESKN